MAQFSYLWTTNATGTGHQVASYTQIHWAKIMEIVGACSGRRGVAPRFANKLSASAVGTTVTIGTGAALVDGHPYESTAPENFTVGPSDSGLERIDRIVLRCDWATFTVLLVQLAGSQNVSPVPPTTTTDSGTRYDITLWQARVNSAGQVTLTDERDWAQLLGDDATIEDDNDGHLRIKDLGVSSAKLAAGAVTNDKVRNGAACSVIGRSAGSTGAVADIAAAANGQVLRRSGNSLAFAQVSAAEIADGAVTNAKLGDDAVDDAKIGNRVAVVDRRKGGSATVWNVAGTTTYTPGNVRIQVGQLSGQMIAGPSSMIDEVVFPYNFAYAPLVFLTRVDMPSYMNIGVSTSPPSGGATDGVIVSITRTTTTNTDNYTFSWMAIGPVA
jgi:hypothetical protein